MNETRLLLLEDDPTSLWFLREALALAGWHVDTATTCAEASAAAHAGHALWLFDAWLPDGHAPDLLAALHARGLAVPAIALSADGGEGAAALLAAGFVRVLAKPIEGALLRRAVAEAIAEADAAWWDDEGAIRALGRAEGLAALRGLFRAELGPQLQRVQAALHGGDITGARAELHRLKAGCGFVGATRLQSAVQALYVCPGDGDALRRLLRVGERQLAED